MKNGGIRAIMFDLGNVSINFDHRFAVEKISHLSHKKADDIYQLFFDSDITALFEEGKISAQDFYLKVKEMLDINISYGEFLTIWNEIFFLTQDNNNVHDLIRKLKSKVVLILISNINQLHYEYLEKQYEIFGYFDRLVLSYEVGARKPDPLIYNKALSFVEGKNRDAVVYIDDREDLIAAAKNLGIKSLCFSGYNKLKKDLSDLGLDIY